MKIVKILYKGVIKIEEKKWTVYKHIVPNGKIYIGITSTNVKQRWNNGKGYKSNIFFTNAIQKYGWENIEHEILFADLDELEAKEKEVELIEKYKSFDKKYGYNLTKGGDGTVGLKRTKEQVQLLKNLLSKTVYQRKLDGTLVKIWKGLREIERETGYLRSSIKAACGGKMKQAYGYIWSFDEKFVEPNWNRKDCKIIYQYSLEGCFIKEWESLSEVSKNLGYNKANISHCCLGTYPSAYGYIWSYEKQDNIKYTNKVLREQKKVYQLDKKWNVISEWESLEEIENSLGHNKNYIHGCCMGNCKTAYGYVWRYEDTLNLKIPLVSEQAKKVLQLTKGYDIICEFESVADAQNTTGITNISNCCLGKYKYSGGYIWVYKDDYEKFDKNEHMKKSDHVKSVNKYDLDMNYIETYISVTDAAKSVNGATGGISRCCKGQAKTAYGYIWKYT